MTETTEWREDIKRNVTPPYVIKMTSSEPGQHCDQFPHGSIHAVQMDEEGNQWTKNRVNSIPKKFPTLRLGGDMVTIKVCQGGCANLFDVETEFTEEDSCIRCHERKHVIGRS